MTDHEYTDKLAITLILWDVDRDDEVYVTMHPVFTDNGFTLRTYGSHVVFDDPGQEVTELPLPPDMVDRLIAGLRAHTYAQRRATVRPRPRDHRQRVGRREGPCAECLQSGWILLPKGRRRRGPNGVWTVPFGWQPCPRCLDAPAGSVAA